MGRAKRNPSINDLRWRHDGFRFALPILPEILAQSLDRGNEIDLSAEALERGNEMGASFGALERPGWRYHAGAW